MSASCHKCSGGAIDALSGECLDCADAARLAELEATVTLLEAENARLKTDLGAASFIASERTRNSIVKWLNRVGPLHVAAAIAACEDINPP